MEYTKEQWKIYAAFLEMISGRAGGVEWTHTVTEPGKEITDVSQLPKRKYEMDFHTGRWHEY